MKRNIVRAFELITSYKITEAQRTLEALRKVQQIDFLSDCCVQELKDAEQEIESRVNQALDRALDISRGGAS